MFRKIGNRFLRAPAFALSVLLLSAILCAALCGLQAANEAEEAQYQQLRQNTPITISVTNLSGTRRTGLNLPNFVVNAINRRDTTNSLAPYVKDTQIRSAYGAMHYIINDELTEGGSLVGITNLAAAAELTSGGRTTVTFYEGYTEELLRKGEPYCIVPESWIPENWDPAQPLAVTFSFSGMNSYTPEPITTYAVKELTVIGTYPGSKDIAYCPFRVLRSIYSALSMDLRVDSISATLIDNSKLEEAREVSKAWFAEPNATGARTPWKYSFYLSYPFALEFDTDVLVSAERSLKTSILLNEICAYLLFIFSAGASFFVGFLMIRSRKREIALMRSVGTGSLRIYLEFALEQMICVIAGVAAGGAAFRWQPIDRVGAFIGIYFVGLSVALLIFLRKNLLATIKEDE